jgi:hypothetical protein
MKISLFAMMIGAAMPATALERSVPLPYQMNNPLANGGVMVKVPSCSPQEFVAVSGTQFVCKDIPNCADGDYLTRQAGVFLCKTLPVAEATNGTYCGKFETIQSISIKNSQAWSSPKTETYSLKVTEASCKGMTTTTQKTSLKKDYTSLTACPAGYSIYETSRNTRTVYGMMISCSSCRGSGNSEQSTPAYRVLTITYTCMKQ